MAKYMYQERKRKLNIRKIVVLLVCVVLIVLLIIGFVKWIISLFNQNHQTIDLSDSDAIETVVIDETYPPFDPFESVEKTEYTGSIEHVFFHPLVIYPELAFDGDYQSKGMDNYMATVTEFKRFIQELYDNNYVLINVNEFYEMVSNENNEQKMKRKKVMFPVDKKPVILSIDDTNYYEYMRENGCGYKLMLDDKGSVVSYSKRPDGTDNISNDTDIIPILDNFVKTNPDFSFNGAKGIIGLTGYDGILGYRTNRTSPNRESEIEAVKPIIAKLHKTGWIFASHSYAHFGFEKAGYDKIVADTEKWKNEVEPLVGQTQVLLYPFGSWEKMDSKEHQYLVDQGFKIFCGVGIKQYEKIYKDFVFMDRKNIDGITLRNRKKSVAHMFDTDKVISLEERGDI